MHELDTGSRPLKCGDPSWRLEESEITVHKHTGQRTLIEKTSSASSQNWTRSH